jgi:hypothetical protein
MSRLQQSRNPGPSGVASFGTLHAHGNHPLRALGRKSVFDTLSDKGKGRTFNLMFGKKRTHKGNPIRGTGRASRLSRPELDRVIADILGRHVGVQNFGRI